MSEHEQLIRSLDLQRHPEGGWYRETHRSVRTLPVDALDGDYDGETRSVVTSILFLLPTGEQSDWHRVRSEELWLHQGGDDLLLEIAGAGDTPDEGHIEAHRVGWHEPARLQCVVDPNCWQRAAPLPGPHGYALVGCVVAPGFSFDDFELVRPS
jgi:predicted cupin superfamily sugar epimerase